MGGFDIQWIATHLTDMMGLYWWLIAGTVVGTAAVVSGLVAPIALRLEETHGTLLLHATHRYR